MNALELADELERPNNWQQENNFTTRAATMLRQQQAEIEALKMGFANSGTHDSELAETRAMAGRLFLKVQDLEFEQEGYENLTEMLESEKAELTEKNCQQQAEIEALKGRFFDWSGFKKLTDEEIADMVCSGEYWELSEGQVIIAVHFDKFARAILRKAQEK